MKRITSILVAILFFSWIIPLGAFIKPSDENKACNGQRAICLCSKRMLKNASQKSVLTLKANNSANASSERESAPSFGGEFLNSILQYETLTLKQAYYQKTALLINQFFARIIDHVPKA